MTTFIYALCEPRSRTVRYIGKSNRPKRRLSAHLSDSKKRENHLCRWLRRVAANGEVPNLVILREVSTEAWQSAETKYIRIARSLGMPLVNSTDGGEGSHNPSSEARAKMGAASRGKTRSQEFRAKVSAAIKGTNNGNFGKVLSPARRAKLRTAMSGRNNPHFGKRLSFEHRAAISASCLRHHAVN